MAHERNMRNTYKPKTLLPYRIHFYNNMHINSIYSQVIID